MIVADYDGRAATASDAGDDATPGLALPLHHADPAFTVL